MIKGIGVDIVKIDRVNDKIVSKVLSSEEISLYKTMSDIRKKEFLAGRFALKEALFKSGIKEPFNTLNIKYNDDNSIYLEKYNNVKVSLSHEREYAIGFAILED